MENHELVELHRRGSLTDLAMSALTEELQSRGITDEVRAKIESEIQSENLANDYLASLGSRLGAQLIDDLIAILLLVISLSIGNIEMLSLAGIAAFLGYILLSDALPNGQSIGKMALKIAVVDKKTNKPCTIWKSLFRNITLVFLGFIDWLFIFGRNRQRLGDMIAGTVVVNAKARAE
jgi:uncharacterized RDD family membrane protein YckC